MKAVISGESIFIITVAPNPLKFRRKIKENKKLLQELITYFL